MKYIIGIDMGGTSVKMLLADEEYRVRQEDVFLTPKKGSAPEEMYDRIVASIENMLAEEGASRNELLGVGIGVPGPVNFESGMIYTLPNVGWKNVPVRNDLEERLQAPVFVDNDGSVNVMGEYVFGAGRGYRNIVELILGTGLGGGVLINGEILRGRDNVAAELGHFVIVEDGEPCGCGNHGCLETYVNISGMTRAAKQKAKEYPYTAMLALADGEPELITPKIVNEACQVGDTAALETLAIYTEHLTTGVNSLINIFNPEVVILSGGISAFGERLLAPLRERVELNLMHDIQKCPIVTGELYQRAGVLGACAMVGHQLGEPEANGKVNE